MNEPLTSIDMTFTPLAVEQDGWYHPAVLREGNMGLPETTVYSLSYESEADALTIAQTLALLEMRRWESSMQATLKQLEENRRNPPPPPNLPNFSNMKDSPPADVRGFTPDQQADWFWRYYYPERPANLPPPIYPGLV